MNELTDKQVLVVGLGASGEAAARFLLGRGARVVATDSADTERLRTLKAELVHSGAHVELGGHSEQLLDGVELVVLSPGVPPSVLPVRLADERGIPVISELELAFRQCAARIAAITGTNGKTTVTHLVHALLEAGGIESVVAGNIGEPFIDRLDAVGANGVIALEVSSFQLERIDLFRPDVGVLLNVAPDHMDRYESLDEYALAKMRLFENQVSGDVAIVHDSVVQMGLRPPQVGEEPRLVVYGESEICDLRLAGETVVGRRPKRRYRLSAIWRLLGRHNLHNAMAAIAVAESFGVDEAAILDGLRHFSGLPHRLELVGVHTGVHYVNDSKATNVDAVGKALDAIASPVVLIAGGLDKELDFEPLRPAVRSSVKTLVLIGEAAPKLERVFGSDTHWIRARSMDEAVELARNAAQPGDTVLLSPGCASFDMFRDYAERGDRFKQCVKAMSACPEATGT
jgi:UDP-N-acetylmuramoylalanine--D-glutamate ligase